MRKALAALTAAAMLSVPLVAPPPTTQAQPQSGLVNVSVDDNNICALCDVGVAVQAIVQACDLVDVNQAQVLVSQTLTSNTPVQDADCDQAGDQALSIEQSTVQQPGGGAPKPSSKQSGLVNVSVDQNNICVGCDVAAAVQAVVQACDLIDVNQAQVLVSQAATYNQPTQVSDCDQDAGNQRLRIQQATTQQG
jgi:hypothetical protein